MYTVSSADVNKKLETKKRASFSVTFEMVPQLLGFGGGDVRLSAVDVDYSREIVHFYFVGDGLPNNCDSKEGQEPITILPPQLFT